MTLGGSFILSERPPLGSTLATSGSFSRLGSDRPERTPYPATGRRFAPADLTRTALR